jgi:hypothetical protein
MWAANVMTSISGKRQSLDRGPMGQIPSQPPFVLHRVCMSQSQMVYFRRSVGVERVSREITIGKSAQSFDSVK